MSESREWPTRTMVSFMRRFVPWAEARIAEEVSSNFAGLRGVPGGVAESCLEEFERIGPAQAQRYMVERIRSDAARMLPEFRDDSSSEFLEATLLEMVQRSSYLRQKSRRGFDSPRFRALLPQALEECGHSTFERNRNIISARWVSGLVEVETQIVLGKATSYLHSVKRAGDLACIQTSFATWLGLDATTTYEPSAEHSPEQVLEHMKKYWRVFLDAVPELVGS